MPQDVSVKGTNVTVSFPDGMTPAAIGAALRANLHRIYAADPTSPAAIAAGRQISQHAIAQGGQLTPQELSQFNTDYDAAQNQQALQQIHQNLAQIGTVHNAVPPLTEMLSPGFHERAQATPGVKGGLMQLGEMLSEPSNLALLAGAGVPELGAGAVTKGLGWLMGANAGMQAANIPAWQQDPAKQATLVGGSGLLAALPFLHAPAPPEPVYIHPPIEPGVAEGLPMLAPGPKPLPTGETPLVPKPLPTGETPAAVAPLRALPPPPEVPPTEPVAVPPQSAVKPPWEMDPNELETAGAAEKGTQAQIEAQLFGVEGAARYAKLQRIANSTLRPVQVTNMASAEIERMESQLTPEQQARLYGVGDEMPGAEDLRDYHRALTGLDWSSPQALGDSLRYAVTQIGEKSDPADMTHSERVAYATLRYAMQEAQENGWPTKPISDAALASASQRFGSPQDAAYMLRRFLKPQEEPATAQEMPAAAPMPPPEALAAAPQEVPAVAPTRSAEAPNTPAPPTEPSSATAPATPPVEAAAHPGSEAEPAAQVGALANRLDEIREEIEQAKEMGDPHKELPGLQQEAARLTQEHQALGASIQAENADLKAAIAQLSDEPKSAKGAVSIHKGRQAALAAAEPGDRVHPLEGNPGRYGVFREGYRAPRTVDPMKSYQASLKIAGRRNKPGEHSAFVLTDLRPHPESLAMQGARRTQKIVYGQHPELHQFAPQSDFAAVQHESRLAQAHLVTAYDVPRVLEPLTPEQRARFQTMAVADRMLDEQRELVEKLQQTSDPKAQKPLRVALDKIALGRQTDPLLDPVTQQPVTPQDVQDYFQQPEVQEAVARHKSLIEPVLENLLKAGGKVAAGNKGLVSGMFTPALALDDNGNALASGGGSGSGGRTAPLLQMPKTPGSDHFEGSAKDYEPDYAKAINNRLEMGYNKATHRALVQTMLDEGAAHPASDDVNTRWTTVKEKDGTERTERQMLFRGKWEPAVDTTVQGKYRFQDKGVTDPDLPTKITLPIRFYNEIRPLFDRSYMDPLDRWAHNRAATATAWFIRGVGDLIQHALALPSRLAKVAREVSGNAITDELIRHVPTATAIHHAAKAWTPNAFTDAERMAALHFAAKTGVLPPDFPVRLENETGFQKWLKSGASKLYGDKGVLANAVTMLYQHFRDTGALTTPEGRQFARDNFRRIFNTYGRTDKSTVEKLFQGVGMGTFYQTGIKNRMAVYNQPMSRYVSTMATTLLASSLLYHELDAQHRWPWQAGAKVFDVPLPLHDQNGQQEHINIGFLDRTQKYANYWIDSLLASHAAGDSPGRTAQQAAYDTGNQVLAPTFTGPVAALGENLWGQYPHLGVGDKVLPPALTKATPTGGLPYTSRSRLLALLESLNPAGWALQEMSAPGKQNLTTAQKAVNVPLNLLGIPGLSTAPPEGLIYRQHRLQERSQMRAAARRGE